MALEYIHHKMVKSTTNIKQRENDVCFPFSFRQTGHFFSSVLKSHK